MSLALLVTGAGGQLGDDLLDQVRSARDVFARGLTRKDLDVTDAFAVQDMVVGWDRIVRSDNPDHRLVVVNCAAYTAVDAAEEDEETAFAVNAAGPALLATACAKAGARLIHVSTDYVFPGDAERPYDVEDETGPKGAYGRTKLAGELAVREILPAASHVVRTAWLYGASGQNFVKTMVRLERERETVSVVDDQRGSPTWSRDLAAGLLALAGSNVPAGTLHATNRGETTWHGFTQAIFEELGADPTRVQPTTSDAFPRPAPRPPYSVLSPRAWDAAGLPPLQDWRSALSEAFRTSGEAFRA
ncbi:MAG: dTDP-4-dehydrorhamnose reductase [Frankiales bacterium]|nr:dTDP-4-dehydrorhamnose reductase [Frankiales bacterium]